MLNQNLSIAWFYRALGSGWRGQHEVAIEQIGRALRLSPLDPRISSFEGMMAQALLMLERYDEASRWATKALSRQSNWMPALRASAAANGLAGNIDEARRMVARIRQHDPQMRLSSFEAFSPFRRAQDVAKWIEGLRLAGLPE